MKFLHCTTCNSKIDLDAKKKDKDGLTVRVTNAEAAAIIKASFEKCPVCEYFKGLEAAETKEG